MLHNQHHTLPPPPSFKKLLGPSFILLGLGLGSGEIILWPYLASHFGLGIAWGAFLGITFQYFINMEIERYSLAHGESVFIGLSRLSKYIPVWLMVSTLLGFSWPGIIASSAFLFTSLFGGNSTTIAIILLVAIGAILSFGKYIYATVEKFSQIIIGFGVPAVLVLTLYVAPAHNWGLLAGGLIGYGDGYWFLPAGIPLASFLAAFAFSGAAGNLNLTQSSYIREKGYGMGAFTQKIKGLFSGSKQTIDLNGYVFHPTPENISLFKGWWKAVNREHAIVFYATGAFTMLLLILLSYSTTFGLAENAKGITFVVHEARSIGEKTLPIIGSLFAGVMGIMLFSTQLSVLDSTSRITSENYAALKLRNNQPVSISKVYYIFLWLQIFFGSIVFLFGIKEPLTLLTLSAVINAVCMFVHIGLVAFLNHRTLPTEIQPPLWRRLAIGISFIFFGTFSAITIWQTLF
jgi:hypothetical protein